MQSDKNAERDLDRDPSPALRLSVVVPAHESAGDVEYCIAALEASSLPRDEWELILINDREKRGPAFARNRGVEKAAAGIVAFVDSDVMVHRDALSRMLSILEPDTGPAAVFGSYDAAPTEKGVVSRYRNLLHHFVHQRSPGHVESFWAGCGGIRKAVFESVGGFDETRFTRPEIEDVELGYRLRDAGHEIILDPRIQCTHRKRWTLAGMIGSDFTRRGLPWTRLLVERGMLLSPRGLSLGLSERLSAGAAVLSVLSFAAAAMTNSASLAYVAFTALSAFVLANLPLLKFLASTNGAVFAIASIPLHLAYSLTATSAFVIGAFISIPDLLSVRERYRLRR